MSIVIIITKEEEAFFDTSVSTGQNNRFMVLLSTLLSLCPPPQTEHRQTSQLAVLADPARAAISLAAGDEFGLVTIGVPPIRGLVQIRRSEFKHAYPLRQAPEGSFSSFAAEGSVVILGPSGPDGTVPTTAA